MMMKRFLPLLLALLFFLSLSACGDSSKASSMDTIRNTKTGDTISLGMSRKDVEKQLGKGTPFDYEAYWKKVYEQHPELKPSGEYENVSHSTASYPDNEFTYGSGEDYISITYENDAVVGFGTKSEDLISDWVLMDGITHGSTLADITKDFGEVKKYSLGTGADGKQYSSLTYCYDASGKQVKGLLSASVIMIIYIDEETNKLVSLSAEVYDSTPTIEFYKSIFEHKDDVQVLDEHGKDITKEYFKLLIPYYKKENWQAVEDGEMDLHVSSIGYPSKP